VTRGLKRYYGHCDFHYITSSCFRRRPLLGSPEARDLFLYIFDPGFPASAGVAVAGVGTSSRRYIFDATAYVVMPEHFHLLISEPERGDPSVVMKILKQTVSRKLLPIRGPRPK
jgi:putative transposase